MRYALILLATLPLQAEDITGTWKAWFTGSGDHPKMASEMTFDLKVDGDKVTGMARIANWPEGSEITDGKLNGKVLSFTVVEMSPWSFNPSANGYPRLEFVWDISGSEARVKMGWGGVILYDSNRGAGKDEIRKPDKFTDMMAKKQVQPAN